VPNRAAGRRDQRLDGPGGIDLDHVPDQLLDEQRVAARALVDDGGQGPRRGRFAQPRAEQLADLALGEAGERDALETPLAPQVAEQRGERGSHVRGLVAVRADDEQWRPSDRPDHVSEHRERGGVRPVQVLDDEQHRRAPRGVADRRCDRLEQAVAGVLRLALRRPSVGVDLRQQPRELGGDPVGKRAAGAGDVLPQRLGERSERPDGVLHAAAREHRPAVGARDIRQLDQQARLPAPRRAGQHHDRGGARARAPPRGGQGGELIAAADERRMFGPREGVRQRERTSVDARCPRLGAQPLDQRARLRRRRHAELAPQRRAERPVGGDRRRGVAAPRQPPHQNADRVLGDRIQLQPAARMANCRVDVAGLLGGSAERGQQVADPVAVRAPLLEHPVVVEVRQQLALRELQRLVPTTLPGEAADLARVDPDVGAVLDPHPVAAGDDLARRLLAELPA
jgi:hypothetical protein